MVGIGFLITKILLKEAFQAIGWLFFTPYFLQTEMIRTMSEPKAIISESASKVLIAITSSCEKVRE